MNTYNIELKIDGVEHTERWSGWTEQVAISQAFLSHAQAGARAIEVLSINLK
jgi:hypothetical protein